MKLQLTEEETAYLLNKGINMDYATAYTYSAPHRTSGIAIGHVFLLADLLQILPTSIDRDDKPMYLDIHYDIEMNEWVVQYVEQKSNSNTHPCRVSAYELIDALNDMVLWLNEQSYIDFAKQPKGNVTFYTDNNI